MRPLSIRPVLALLVCALAASAPARAELPAPPGALLAPDLLLESYGVYCGPEGEKRKAPAPDTELGFIMLSNTDPRASVITQRVPAALGLAFGAALRLRPGLPERGVTFRVTHPATLPGSAPGARVTESWPITLSPAGPSLNRFSFDLDRERVPGLWVMEVVDSAGTPLFRLGFDVVPPEAAPSILQFCTEGPPLS